MSVPEMAPLNPEPFGGGGDRPYRPNLYPPEPTTRRRIVTSKDEVQVDEAAGTAVRLPVEQRPPKRIKRITTFGVEQVEVEVDDKRKDHHR